MYELNRAVVDDPERQRLMGVLSRMMQTAVPMHYIEKDGNLQPVYSPDFEKAVNDIKQRIHNRVIEIRMDFMKSHHTYQKSIIPHVFSPQEINQVMLEKVSLEDRLKAVYIPTILLDMCCILSEQLLGMLGAQKYSATRELSKGLKNAIDDYKDSNMKVMGVKLFYAVQRKSRNFFNSILRHIQIMNFSYNGELLHKNDICVQGRGGGKMALQILSMCFVCRTILEYVIQYDRESANKIQNALEKDHIQYRVEDNVFCVAILNYIKDIIRAFDGPVTLSNVHIEMSYEIFKKEVNLIDIKDI